MKAHQRTEGLNDEWITPPEISKNLRKFDLDPCAAIGSPYKLAKNQYFSRGLESTWSGRVWLNPPFNRYERPKWMEKMANHANGIMLIPAATETMAFYRYVWKGATAVCFLKGRPHFHYVDGTRAKANCGCSIVLVAYGEENAVILDAAGLGKTLWI